jgi:hypothetical protein
MKAAEIRRAVDEGPYEHIPVIGSSQEMNVTAISSAAFRQVTASD